MRSQPENLGATVEQIQLAGLVGVVAFVELVVDDPVAYNRWVGAGFGPSSTIAGDLEDLMMVVRAHDGRVVRVGAWVPGLQVG